MADKLKQAGRGGNSGRVLREESKYSEGGNGGGVTVTKELSAASQLTLSQASSVTRLVLKFTTLSDGNEQAAFSVGRDGCTIGRAPEKNGVFVPSDATLAPYRHATIAFQDGHFLLADTSVSDHRAAVRVGTGHAAPEWPLTPDCAFSCGNSVFVVEDVTTAPGHAGGGGKGSRVRPTLTLIARTGPKKGSTIVVTADGCTMGRANDNTVTIADRELSRRHSQVVYREGSFYVADMGSTNGTYVQLVGPYGGAYPLHLGDHLLVGRTGFSVNRFDFGVSEEMGMRRTMEDKSATHQDMAVPELSGVAALCPQTWLGVYDGHGGGDASAFLERRLHAEVSLSLGRAAPHLREAALGGGGARPTASPHAAPSLEALDAAVRGALSDAFNAADGDFLAGGGVAGSTATTVLVLGQRLYCANVGDSRTVLGRAGGKAHALSEDHKPSREDEAARIKAAGGFIINKRVMGELAVSRAFGDSEFKKGISEILGEENVGGAAAVSGGGGGGSARSGGGGGGREEGKDGKGGAPPASSSSSFSSSQQQQQQQQQQQDLSQPLVIAEPEVTVTDLRPDDDFLLLACDGLFDVMTNQAACDLVVSEMRAHGDAQRCAAALSHTAIDVLGSRDNVTVLVVLLRDDWYRQAGGGGSNGGGGNGGGGNGGGGSGNGQKAAAGSRK